MNESVYERFESAWTNGGVPELSSYLPGEGDSRRHRALLELIRLDLEFRWRRAGTDSDVRPLRLRDYQKAFPELTDAELLSSGLIAKDYRVRRRFGETINPSDFAAEFADNRPAILAELRKVDAEFAEEETLPPSAIADEDATLRPPAASQDSDSTTSPEISVSVAETYPGQFGNYDLLFEIARGGMGVVYKAKQRKLNRIVALKMIKSGQLAGQDEVQRFHTEAEAAAQLDHPNIVPIYEVGEQDGLHFFSMGFVDGKGLDTRLKDGPLPPREAAELIRTIAAAVHYAHEKGIVHRDLKPANVLVDAGGQPRITDFGLAKNTAIDSGLTATGQVMGTPSYMPPEQAAGKTEQIGPLADVYSLGATLYDALTGRPPFVASTPMDTLIQVLESAPAPPQVLNTGVPKDLQTICLKCLEKNPRHRFPSAKALAEDLDRWLNGESIQARTYNLFDRIASAIDRSHYDVQFTAWGSMLLGFAVVIGIGHVATSAILVLNPDPLSLIGLVHLIMFAALLALFWRKRPQGLMPRTTAERQLWCLLGGFVTSCALTGIVDRLLSSPEQPHEPLHMYPLFAVLSGLTFLVLGASYWGACFLFAAGFWVLSLMLPLCPELGPAGFGILWMAGLVTIGRHLKRLGASCADRDSRDGSCDTGAR